MAEDYGYLDSKKVVLSLRGDQEVCNCIDRELERLVRQRLQQEAANDTCRATATTDAAETREIEQQDFEKANSPASDIQIR
jgi:hypothetical protein